MITSVEHRILPRDGESACGDTVVVRTEGEFTLLAVVDALGHGVKAGDVATIASAWLDGAALQSGVAPLMDGLHAALRGTRGACALLCVIGSMTMEVCSVGNVEMRWLKAKPPFVLTPGVLGQRMLRPRIFRTAALKDDRLVIFSDGISGRFDLRETSKLSTAEACRAIFTQHRRSHDDATLLMADLGG